MRTGARPRNRAFTIIELLVVIAIIAILAGMLLAGLRHARYEARNATCKSNLSQIARALAIYATANDGWLPITKAGPNAAGYLAFANSSFIGNPRVLHCPLDYVHEASDGPLTSWVPLEENSCQMSYGYVNYLDDINSQVTFRNSNRESERPLVWDLYGGKKNIIDTDPILLFLRSAHGAISTGQLAWGGGETQLWRALGGNVAFMDGHVAWVDYETWYSSDLPAKIPTN
jgi:prepilin-type N-terminal cleavage/methylation domain-containing protein/prepilin-type processing-associated H-X9-DG protein